MAFQFLKIFLFFIYITKEAKIGIFEINSLEELGGSKVQLVDESRNEYHQLCDFESNMGAGFYGFNRVGIAPYLNISNDCRDKLLEKNPYAQELLIYKIFRFRESDPEKEPTNKQLGVLHVYESFFQLFYYRNNDIDKYTKVDVEGVCAEKIALFLMHTLDNETMTTNFKNVQNQCPIKAPVQQFLKWYDTLNPNSDFYNSICIGYTYNTLIDKFLKNETKLKYYDTPLDIRKKYFFGNLYLCPDYCTYSGIFSVAGFLLITCHCDDPKMDLLSDITIIPEKQYMQPFDFNEEEFFSKSHDSYFSIGVFTCYMFTFILGLTNNYGCYIILGIAGVIIFSFVELLIFNKKRILSVLELLYNNNINTDENNIIKNGSTFNLNNSKENILSSKNDNDLISLSNKGDVEPININKNKKTNNNKNIRNNFAPGVNNKNKYIQKPNINNSNKQKGYYDKKPIEKYENEDEEIDNYEDLRKKDIKIYQNDNIYNINQNNRKKEKTIKRIPTNYEREEESEDSDKVQAENAEVEINNEQNNIKNEEEGEYEEGEEEYEEVEGQNANPPKIKIKMKRQNYNELSSNRNELSSNQKLANEKLYNISPNKINFNNNNNQNLNQNKKNTIDKNQNNQRAKEEEEEIENIEQYQREEENKNQQKLNNQKSIQNNGQEVNINSNSLERQKSKNKSRVTFKSVENLKIDKIMNTHNDITYIPKSNLYITIDNIFTDQELNSMNFIHSLKYDKRTFYQIYFSFINYQIPLFFLLHYYNSNPNEIFTFQIRYPSAKLIYFCYEIYICFFFNTTVFGTKSVAYQFYGTYTFWKHLAFAVVLCPFCLIFNSFFHYLLFHNIKKKIIQIKLWCFTKLIIYKKGRMKEGFEYFTKKEYVSKYHRTITKLEDIKPNDIERKVKHHKDALKKLITTFLGIYQKKIITSIIFSIFGSLIMWYYVTSLCVAFKNSQGNYLLNVLLTFILCNLLPAGYCFLPAYVRHKSLTEQNKTYFILSQILRAI